MVPQSNESQIREGASFEAASSPIAPSAEPAGPTPHDAPSEGREAQAGSSSENGDAPEQGAAPGLAALESAPDREAGEVADTDSDEGDAGSDNGVEGDTSDGAPGESSAQDATGAPREKKRRRRRRGKKGHGAAVTANPEGALTADGEAAPTTTAMNGATPSDAPSSPTGAAGAGGAGPQHSGKDKPRKDARKKARAPRPEQGPARERAAFHVGEEVFGRVTSVTEHAIMVDLSGKALAIFDRHELADDDLVPEVGDRFVAHIHGDGSRGGFVVLTRKPLREEEAKPRLEAAATSGALVSGLVTGVVKGGIEVDVDGLRAFAPGSHVDLRPGADLAHLIGRRLEFNVAQYAKRGRDVVVSRKNFIEAEAKDQRKASLGKLQPGSVVKGIVRSVVAYGAFVAIPGADDVEGLVHMTEASHDRHAKLTDVFKVGAEIDVKVLRVDEKGKLWLSHRAATVDPWEEAMKTFAAGTRHRGKVLRLLPFGAFIELAPGVEGLLHTADLSFKRIEHPQDVLKEGEEIDVIVAEVERGTHKLALHPCEPCERCALFMPAAGGKS